VTIGKYSDGTNMIVNVRTKAFMDTLAHCLGYTTGLTVYQGEYHPGFGPSGGTHDAGACIDLSPNDYRRKQRMGRRLGAAAWHRPFNWDGAGGEEHVHVNMLGDHEASPEAKAQWPQYLNYQNGLADAGADNSWHPFPKGGPSPVFSYTKYKAEVDRVVALRQALHDAKAAITHALNNAQSDRQRANLRSVLKTLNHATTPAMSRNPATYTETRTV